MHFFVTNALGLLLLASCGYASESRQPDASDPLPILSETKFDPVLITFYDLSQRNAARPTYLAHDSHIPITAGGIRLLLSISGHLNSSDLERIGATLLELRPELDQAIITIPPRSLPMLNAITQITFIEPDEYKLPDDLPREIGPLLGSGTE